MMKVTIEIPDSAVCLTHQCFFVDQTTCAMTVRQGLLDTGDLKDFRREENEDENP